MKIFNSVASLGHMPNSKAPFSLFRIQHLNFVDIKEAYLFKDKIFTIIEYMGFSVYDLL